VGSRERQTRSTREQACALAGTPGARYGDPAMTPQTRPEGDVEGLIEQFRAYLAKKGLKSTRQRDIIVERFFSHTGHLSIEQLLAIAREDYPRLGYATVYRTLKLLTECGLAAERRFGEGQTMFEAAGDLEHHDHLICLECNHVLEFHNEAIEQEQERVARSFGFTVIRCPGDDARAGT